MRHSFTLDGMDMRERFGLIVERFEDVLIPALRPRKLKIPERDGAYDYGAEFYDERELTVHCAAAGLTRAECRELALAATKKSRIVRWDEPDKYYIGRIYNAAEIERLAGQAKRFPLTFVCEPFAYGKRVSGPLPERMAYAGTAPTATYIRIINTGTGTIHGLEMTIRREVKG